MAPRIPVIGLHLTYDAAAIHLKTCLSLLSLINHQFPAITHLDANQLNFVSHLQSIQVRHSDIQSKLSSLVKDLSGAEAWVSELGDALMSMKGKVRQCNHMSASASQIMSDSNGRAGPAERERDWQLAATTYWPMIADSYVLVKPLLETVRDEMSDALDVLEGGKPSCRTILAGITPSSQLQDWKPQQKAKTRLGRSGSIVQWFGGKRQYKPSRSTLHNPFSSSSSSSNPAKSSKSSKSPEAKHVRFIKDVNARWFFMTEAPDEGQDKRDHIVPLTSDRKRTAGTYKILKPKVKAKAGKYGTRTGNESSGGWIPSTAVF